MVIDPKMLKQIKGKELFPGATFYLLGDNGEFERCVVELEWYPTPNMRQLYREWVVKKSTEGKLFSRRDKAFKDFRDVVILKL